MTILTVAVALGAAGLVKGLAGVGLPLLAVPLMALSIDLVLAVALMPISLLITNLWQVASSRHVLPASRRFWPMILLLPVGAVLGVKFLAEADPRVLSAIVGGAVITASLLMQFQPDWQLPKRLEHAVGPVAGFASGLLGGVSAMFSPPLILFLVSLRLEKEQFVGAIGLMFVAGVIPMVVALGLFEVLSAEGFLWSALAAIPVFLGQLAGQLLRRRIPEKPFRLLVLILLLASGLNLIRQAFA